MSNDHGDQLTCGQVAARDLVDRYATGRLAPADAEAFEEHYFACDACWHALKGAMALAGDAASRRPPTSAAREPVRSLTIGAAKRAVIGAAALVVVAVAGVFLWASRPDMAPPASVRGAAVGLALDLVVTDDSISGSWSSVDGAMDYHVRLFTPDGALIHESNEEAPSFGWARASRQRSARLFILVEARDRVGTVLATSGLHPVDDER